MKHLDNNRLTRDNLQRLYPLPKGFAQRMEHTLHHLTQEKELPVKRKLSFVLIFAVVALLALGGYALSQYGVLDFLFEAPSQDQITQLTPLTKQLNIHKTVDNITLQIHSVLYDGESFALDWIIKNEQPDQPRFVEIAKYEMGEQKLWSDGSDGFDSQWLPGYFSEDGTMQNGEYTQLPLEKLTGNIQQVNMELSIYTPTKPLFYLEQNEQEMSEEEQNAWRDKQNIVGAQKLKEGYIVMDGDMFFMPYPPDEHNNSGFARVIGALPDILKEEDYAINTLSVSFELDITAARQAHQVLTPNEEYAFNFMTTRYTKAVKTPLGIYLEMLIKPIPGKEEAFEQAQDTGEWALSDGRCNKIDIWPLESGGSGYHFPDGAFGRKNVLVMPLPEKDVPEEISLTFYPQDGSAPLVSPIKTK